MSKLSGHQPIGIFDSGIGGLSVLSKIWQKMPNENYFYIADQAHVPYGSRKKQEILEFSSEITNFLMGKGCKLIVLACNTASAAALLELRNKFPDFQFVGMEPALKPAAEKSVTGVVGVLATPSTFEGELFESVVTRFGMGALILQDTCSGLVEEIEGGRANGVKAMRILEDALTPMIEQGLDSIVLGCTHYPFSRKSIRNIVGKDVEIYDPAPAIANRVHSLLVSRELRNDEGNPGALGFLTTGDVSSFESVARRIFPEAQLSFSAIKWNKGIIEEAR